MVIVCPFSSPETPPLPYHEKVLADFDSKLDNVALVDGESEQKWTFGQVRQMAYSVAHALTQHGFKKGDILAFYVENRPAFAPILLGVSALGGAVSGANPLYRAEELGRQIVDSGAKYMLTNRAQLPTVLKSVPENHLKVIFIFEQNPENSAQFIGQTRIVPVKKLFIFDKISQFPNVRIDPKKDVVLLPYSSGTTGVPKGVLLTHENINVVFFSKASEETGLFRLAECGESMILVLPFFHAAGFLGLTWSLVHGAEGVILRRFEPLVYLKLTEKYRASILLIVPTIMVFLAKHPDVSKFDLSCVKRVAVGAAPTGKELIQALLKRLPQLETVTQGYGMTETAGLLTVSPNIPIETMPIGSVGVPIPGVEMKVVDIDGGQSFKELGPLEKGEIWARGPGNMKGYISQPEDTKKTIDSDGWLHTGDIGYYDHFGHFYVVDRLKELIKYKGYQVAPAELEDLILRHPAVQEVGVVGYPNPEEPGIGELPTAFIVIKPGIPQTKGTADSIKKHVADHAANYKQLRGGIVFCKALPKSGAGKMLRKELRNLKIDSIAKL